jgi:hypothetical protein
MFSTSKELQVLPFVRRKKNDDCCLRDILSSILDEVLSGKSTFVKLNIQSYEGEEHMCVCVCVFPFFFIVLFDPYISSHLNSLERDHDCLSVATQTTATTTHNHDHNHDHPNKYESSSTTLPRTSFVVAIVFVAATTKSSAMLLFVIRLFNVTEKDDTLPCLCE